MSLSLTIPSTEEIHHLRFNPDDYEFLETDVKPEDKLSEEDQQVCPEINERQVNGGIKPKYELDPNLFITPVYIWGPSSQLQGLREGMYQRGIGRYLILELDGPTMIMKTINFS